ncbi:hypothetical protein OLMES_5212 [Oleiphilus messinensis]|uniref:diguanylate cyclase n=2 Tax=Oleiphilus messinensis TaxID=141451 RepID=A0A1Y0IH70_9GAMM|nr:hypothetical protein OLMES_5212 [Oleiphilus messinensis]
MLGLLWSGAVRAQSLEFGSEEQAYLASKGELMMCVDPDWMPYERINDQGVHEGIAADYMRLVAERIGIPIQLVPSASWAETMAFARARKCDIISMARKTQERLAHFDFTQPYLSYPFVIATQIDQGFIENFDAASDQSFAAVKGYAVTEYLKNRYPDTPLVEVQDIDEGIHLVRENMVFGYIDSALALGYKIKERGTLDIKVSGQLDFSSSPAIAVRNDEPVLVGILDQALASISSEERQTLYNEWVSIRFEQGTDYTLLVQMSIAAGLIVFVTMFWNHRLIRANRKTRHALAQLHEAQRLLEEQNFQLQRLATIDPLTGLQNRLKINESIEHELQRFRRFHKPFSVIMLDLDDFKKVNDEHGHQAGDDVLIEFSGLLSTLTRSIDLIGRWGGEEFIIICPDTTLSGATCLAEKIRQQIEAHRFMSIGQKTCSMGVTVVKGDDTIQSLIGRADQALYQAKDKGRNRVQTASGPVDVSA